MAKPLNWQLGTVIEIREETPTVKSLVLDPLGWPGHLAGQHVDVRLTAPDGYQAQRSYSIASAPGDRSVMITVERLADGEVSPYLTDEIKVGDQLEFRGPIGGYFVWDTNGDRDKASPLFLVAGGSGIVPLMSMIRHRARSKIEVPTRLLYSSRTYDDVIYQKELVQFKSQDASLSVFQSLTRGQPPNWPGYSRRIDQEMLAETVWQVDQEPVAYVCGPTALVESVATYLQDFGYKPESIKTERFGPTGT